MLYYSFMVVITLAVMFLTMVAYTFWDDGSKAEIFIVLGFVAWATIVTTARPYILKEVDRLKGAADYWDKTQRGYREECSVAKGTEVYNPEGKPRYLCFDKSGRLIASLS